jgi:pimeloyl-ACP methyl ester carboxylesterase
VTERTFFEHEGFTLRYIDTGAGEPVLLVHGFASNLDVNWVNPGWVKTLTEAGFRVIAFDHRGHGRSSSSHDPQAYAPQAMAGDAFALLDKLGISRAHFVGYSMGARVSAFASLIDPTRVATLTLGGLGMALVDGSGFWGPVREALLTQDIASITDAKALMFRKFADQTKSDRIALAACIEGSRANIPAETVRRISAPTLIAVGTLDDVSGAAGPLAALIPGAEAFDILGRDHMLSVGDRTFKARLPAFLKAHPIS